MARHLLPDEFLVMPTLHKHWVVLVKPLVIPTLVVVVVAGLVNVLAPGVIAGIVTLMFVGAAAVWAFVALLIRLASSLTVTNQRVIQEEGLLRRTSNVIPVDRIQDISIKQSVAGRLLDYGDIEIDTAGVVANEVFTHVPGPEKLRDQLFMVSAQRRRPPGAGDGT